MRYEIIPFLMFFYRPPTSLFAGFFVAYFNKILALIKFNKII
nr:MAG TPA: hypothetical protein [Caudoviricetes sp.]